MVERQHARIALATVENGRDFTDTTQAAARTLAFVVAEFRSEFE